MRVNPFEPLYAVFNSGTNAKQMCNGVLGPAMIDLEVASLCNMRCVMCPTGLHALGRPGTFMTEETFFAILNQTAPFKSALRFIGWGEPTLHHRLIRFITLAARRGRLTHLNTNGTTLASGTISARELIASGLSSIKFSFQGTDADTYQAMRRSDFFDELLHTIQLFHDIRGDNPTPFIAASTTTTDETPDDVAEFTARLAPFVDQLSIGATVFDFIEQSSVAPSLRERLRSAAASQNVVKRHPSPCPEVYNKLSIHADGTVRVCCNDYSGHTNLGNIRDDPLDALWNHPGMIQYRRRLAANEYSGPLCSVCYDYMDLTNDPS